MLSRLVLTHLRTRVCRQIPITDSLFSGSSRTRRGAAYRTRRAMILGLLRMGMSIELMRMLLLVRRTSEESSIEHELDG